MSDYDEYPLYPAKKKKRSPQAKHLRWMLLALVLLTAAPLLLTLGFLMGEQSATPSEAGLIGVWTGTLYQNDGGLKSAYPFEMTIKDPDGGHVSVATTIWLDDTHEYYATMGGFGVGVSTTMRFYDVNILNENPPPGGLWCIKKGELTLKDGVLSGAWTGEAGGQTCAPGRIELTRRNS